MGRKKIPTGYDTVIGKNSTFKGNIESKGGLRVDGLIVGDVEVESDILIGKEGKVCGNIKAINVHLSGTVEGNITATGILKIQSSTKLLGDVLVKSFVADEGAVFQGQCRMLDYDNGQDKKSSVTAENEDNETEK